MKKHVIELSVEALAREVAYLLEHVHKLEELVLREPTSAVTQAPLPVADEPATASLVRKLIEKQEGENK